jgi:hypothetical protein
MFRLSSNFTLFWKLFFPTFYLTFFGLLILASFTVDPGDVPFLANPIVRIAMIVIYLLFLLFMWFTIMDIKRVEADNESLYVTNYLKSYKYSRSDVVSIDVKDFILFKVTSLVMKEKTKMGKKITFIGDYNNTLK